MIRLMFSAFKLIIPAQLNISQIMSPSENFSKDALVWLHHVLHRQLPEFKVSGLWLAPQSESSYITSVSVAI